MGSIYIEIDQNVPRYACTYCYNCPSVMGKSLCSLNNRGCCWYFPKFTLLDIQRMVKTLEGIQVLGMIRNNPGTVVNDYYLHAKGLFDKDGYEKWLKSNNHVEMPVKDCTIFFRACPFVKNGTGCTLPPRFRTVVCNFFICDDILNREDIQEAVKPYITERSRYAAWVEWENRSLEHLLKENNVTLISNFDAAINILQNTPLDIYEFPELEPIIINDDWNTWNKGA